MHQKHAPAAALACSIDDAIFVSQMSMLFPATEALREDALPAHRRRAFRDESGDAAPLNHLNVV